ncbi:hypothetical protein [Streptomyces sp. NPDC058695]|uniref:hypothetical protein n=1 Tax=Streptomyces sp. NPDC058695 TaxID=3346604 RepID=UPI003661769A
MSGVRSPSASTGPSESSVGEELKKAVAVLVPRYGLNHACPRADERPAVTLR